MPVDVERYTRHLREKSETRSQRKCAKFVREALAAGGAHTRGAHTVDAKDWGPMLLRLGFHQLTVEDTEKFVPIKGDVIVLQPY